MPITSPTQFAAELMRFTQQWGEKLLSGNAQEYDAALVAARPLAKYGRITPERIVQGAAAKWLRICEEDLR